MRKQMIMLVAATVALSVVYVGVAYATGEPTDSIPAAKQTMLLDKFGDQGIDADDDGVLTHEEIKTFFAKKHHPGAAGMHGVKGGKHKGMGGCFGHGMDKGMHHGMMGRMDFGDVTEEHIAKMLEHHPEVDTDGDGLLSKGEFEAFRAQRMEEHRAKMLERHPEADTDEDGVLSDSEFETFHAQQMMAHRAKMLEHHPEADTDGDGALSDEEARVFKGDHPGGFGCKGSLGHGGGWPCRPQRQEAWRLRRSRRRQRTRRACPRQGQKAWRPCWSRRQRASRPCWPPTRGTWRLRQRQVSFRAGGKGTRSEVLVPFCPLDWDTRPQAQLALPALRDG